MNRLFLSKAVDDFYWQPKRVKDKISERDQRLIDEALAARKVRRFPAGFTREIPWQIWEKGYLKLPKSPAAGNALLARYTKVRIELAAGTTVSEIRRMFRGYKQLESFLEGLRVFEPHLLKE